FQSLQGNDGNKIEKIILTASGGPFRKRESLEGITVADALAHPNWSMGKKITIDSATLMNKGLEVIEAKWLFDVPLEKIQVTVHPQSIIHSAVEYEDGAVIAQLGVPDMKVPIQYALTYPKRVKNSFKKLDLFETATLTFEKPQTDRFKCLSLAYRAIETGGTMPCVMNGANEVAVHRFLKNEIEFLQIPEIIERVMNSHSVKYNYTLEDVLAADEWSRKAAADIKF
ncbi:MAG: 1-deoxy-D-xylulose-5-phosphate reductoisomerase, partial [Firmicutes bacterium]|nr:1-deoxy-D-xylulose-5-phosphate reductoisomerase [Bacillota bacterium]